VRKRHKHHGNSGRNGGIAGLKGRCGLASCGRICPFLDRFGRWFCGHGVLGVLVPLAGRRRRHAGCAEATPGSLEVRPVGMCESAVGASISCGSCISWSINCRFENETTTNQRNGSGAPEDHRPAPGGICGNDRGVKRRRGELGDWAERAFRGVCAAHCAGEGVDGRMLRLGVSVPFSQEGDAHVYTKEDFE
jgi:hypothetical protein